MCIRDSIYPGGVDGSAGKSSSGRTANAGMYFESSRYMQEQNFTSIASEWNSKASEMQMKVRCPDEWKIHFLLSPYVLAYNEIR